MKKKLLITSILASNLFFSQIIFEKGYYTDKKGNRSEVLIKNYEWKSNPSQIEVKSLENATVNVVLMDEIQEFEVGDIKYISAFVEIDKSSSSANSLSSDKSFNLKQENLLLKVLAEGDINFYRYTGGNITRFFIKNKNEEIKPLLFKEYITDGKYIQKNEEYKRQLKEVFIANGKNFDNQIDKTSYKESDLLKLFTTAESVQIKSKDNSEFKIYIKPGIGFSKYEIFPVETSNVQGTKSNSLMFRVGLELEYIFNFNKGKWAVTSEPGFQSVKHKISDFNRRDFVANFSSIQVPVSIKHYIFLNQNSKFYISGGLYTNIWLNEEKNFNSGNIYYTFAGGYNYKKFGAELRYGATPYFNTSVYGQSSMLSMDGFNFALSYQLF